MSLNDCAADLGRLEAHLTADGSFSLHSSQFREAFHNSAGALNEANAKYVVPAQLEHFQPEQTVAILDVCFGLRYNSAAVMHAMPVPPPSLRWWWGLELDQRPLDLALEQPSFQQMWSTSVLKRLRSLQNDGGWWENNSQGRLIWGDARKTLVSIPANQNFDLILLDAFSPQRYPQLWSEEFLAGLAERLKPGGRLITYSHSAAIRASLQRAGLQLFSLMAAPGERLGWSSGTMAVQRAGEGCPMNGAGWRPLSAM